MAASAAQTDAPVFDVRQHGARGDGATLDTAAINRAIEACSQAGGGEVTFPAGRYLSGTLRLRSHVTLSLSAGARIIGTTNLVEYQQPSPRGTTRHHHQQQVPQPQALG